MDDPQFDLLVWCMLWIVPYLDIECLLRTDVVIGGDALVVVVGMVFG